MKKVIYLLLCLPFSLFAQIHSVRINEIEPSTSDSNAFEFIELYGPAGQSLDSLTLVLFNGINSMSYFAVHLDGLSLNEEGFLLIAPDNSLCADLLTGVEQNWMQDGTDGVALFIGSPDDWPNGTLAQSDFLIDAMVYGLQNNAPGLTSVLMGGQPIVIDNTALTHSSYSRIIDGGAAISSAAFTVQYPTPGYSNAIVPCVPYSLSSQEVVLQCLDSVALFSAEFAGGSGALISYILTDDSDVILEVIDSFPYDFTSFPAGEFRVRAASYSHLQSFDVNSPLADLVPYCGEGCFEISHDYARIIRYSCAEPCIDAAITSSEGDTIYSCFQDTSIFSVSSGALIGQTIFILEDANGAVVQTSVGGLYEISASQLDEGIYSIYALNSTVIPDSLELDSLLNIPGYTLTECFNWLNDTIHLAIDYCANCTSTTIGLTAGNTDLNYCMENPEALVIGAEIIPDQGGYSYCLTNSSGDILQWNDYGNFNTTSLSPGEYILYGVHYAYPSSATWQNQVITVPNLSEVLYCFELSSPLTIQILNCSNGIPCQHLFISEYIESDNVGRAIELYNPSTQEINLSGYSIGIFQNGDSSATLQIGLQGYVNPGDAYVIASGAGLAEAVADDTSFQLIYNGNDAIALMFGDSLIDVVGRVGENPGNAWMVDNGSTQNAILRRNPVFSAPETDWTFSAPQWDFTPIAGQSADFENLGNHYAQNCNVPAFANFETSAILVEENDGIIDLVVDVSGLTDTAFLSISAIDGTAIENEDWVWVSPEFQMILPGSSQIIFQIQLIDDTLFEDEIEYISFQLADSTGVFLINNPNISISISASDIEYSSFAIADLIITTLDGNAIYLDEYAVIRGVTQGINFNPEGLEFPFVEGSAALRVFNSFENAGYEFAAGDSLQIWGRLGQFAGMAEFYPDSIEVIAQGLNQETPSQVTMLDETLESHLVRLDCVELTDTSQWIPNGSGFDVTLHGAEGLYNLHLDLNTDIFNAAVPVGKFDVTGVVVQFDETSPYTEGYSIWPRSLNDFEEFVTASFVMPSPLTYGDSGVTVAFENNSQGASSYLWNFGDGNTSDTIAPIHFYSYDYISPLAELQVSLIVNGAGCSDTSSTSVDLVYSSTPEFSSKSRVTCYPNPFRDMIRIESYIPIESICVFDMTGKEYHYVQNHSGLMYLDLKFLASGVYTLLIQGENMLEVIKLIKE